MIGLSKDLRGVRMSQVDLMQAVQLNHEVGNLRR